MNTARSHAQAVWRTSQTQNILNPDGSIGKIEVCSATVDSIEGAIQAYHQEATADLQSEHAREIRRLNAALDFMRCQNYGADQIIRTNLTIIDRKDAEIAQLKADRDTWKRQWEEDFQTRTHLLAERDAAHAEIARLKEDNEPVGLDALCRRMIVLGGFAEGTQEMRASEIKALLVPFFGQERIDRAVSAICCVPGPSK